MKIALFTDSLSSIPRPLESWAEGLNGYTRVSEWVDMQFSMRRAADYVPEQIAALDEKIQNTLVEQAVVIQKLKDARANLLAITNESA